MSSVLSYIKAGKWKLPPVDAERWEDWLAIASNQASRICRTGPDAPKLVNIQAVMADVTKPEGDDLRVCGTFNLPPLTPGFPDLWLECVMFDDHLGFLVHRESEDGGWAVYISTWELRLGRVIGPSVLDRVYLSLDGYLDPNRVSTKLFAKRLANSQNEKLVRVRLLIVLSTLARMNCRNVELRQIPGAKAPRYQGAPNPASIWHEIHISSVPHLRSTGKDATGQTDERLIRCHWIRGHYADYTKGPGLFGNPKLRCSFWIPEHQKGNEDLGHVIPEYVLER